MFSFSHSALFLYFLFPFFPLCSVLFIPAFLLSPPQSFQIASSLYCQPMFPLFLTQSAHLPLRVLGMQVLSLLSLRGSLSHCMKMNFYGLLTDCLLLYISSLSAIMSLIAHNESVGLCSNPIGERSPSVPHQF